MEKYTVVKLKDKDIYGYVEIGSNERFKTLNLVRLEDNSLIAAGDDDLEVDNDRTEKFNSEIKELFNQ